MASRRHESNSSLKWKGPVCGDWAPAGALPLRSRHVVLVACMPYAHQLTRLEFLSIRSSEAENSASGMQACTVVEHFCRLVAGS